MFLIKKIKLYPTKEQEITLLKTICQLNSTCNYISKIAWDEKCFNRFKLHHKVYYPVRNATCLAAQAVTLCTQRVVNSYKSQKKVSCKFKQYAAVPFDKVMIAYRNGYVSIWTVDGRIKVKIKEYFGKPYLPQCNMLYKNGKFFMLQPIEIHERTTAKCENFIGVDFGLTDIAVTSDGIKHSADWINQYREKQQTIRSSIQSKGTRSARRLLKRLTGKERTTATIINHTISKSIVQTAKEQGSGIAIEDLTNIRFTSKRRSKKFRTKLGRWSFYQLRQFLTYKAKFNGVNLIVVEPAYTSKTCSKCYHIGIRNNKSFKCSNCGNSMDADVNASINIATLGAVINQPEKSTMYCSLRY